MLAGSHGDKDSDEYEDGDKYESGPTGLIFMKFMFPNGRPQAEKFISWGIQTIFGKNKFQF